MHSLISNISAGITRTLAGAQMMIANLQGDKARETAVEIEEKSNNRRLRMACDVTKAGDIDALVTATVDAFGGISTLINNVSWDARHEDPTQITEEQWVNGYKLNTVGAYR